MEIISGCLVLASLSVTPFRSQFFWYEQISLRCTDPSNSSSWTVWRNTSRTKNQQCRFGWGLPRNDSCTMRGTDSSDTGVYWCRSERGGCSNAINITVNNGVILESPPLPVTEGETVTLRCSYKEKRQPQSISKFSAAFFHNDVFIGNHSTGKMNFMVSKSDEGFYKCKHPTKGESLQSWLSVTVGVQPGNFTPTPGPPQALTVSTVFLVCTILLITLYTIMTVACISVHRQLAKARADAKRAADRQMAN